VPDDKTMFGSLYMPCPDCGDAVLSEHRVTHECAVDRRVDFEAFNLRAGVESLGDDVAGFLASPHGRFETWSARNALDGGSA
jgi:hypothetical protein